MINLTSIWEAKRAYDLTTTSYKEMDTINEFLGVELVLFDTIHAGCRGFHLSVNWADLWLADTNVQKPAKKFPQGLEMGKSVGVLTKVPSIRKTKNHFYGILFPQNRNNLVPQCD